MNQKNFLNNLYFNKKFMNIFEKNRIWRLEYFLWWILVYILLFIAIVLFFYFIIVVLFLAIFSASNWSDIYDRNFPVFWILIFPLLIFSIYFFFILTIKRLHDTNLNWWWSLLFIFISFVLWFIPWTPWKNRFWDSPKLENNNEKIVENDKKLDF